ncbi:hypothetical protein ICY_01969 [Bacillus cereus BAG2X1-3]|nr:hypothetical protein ICU_02117 [Bacillus cereus BAG2X1-1]EJS76746.1 hypothetical protein ICY_01969 [Bacillus cereus BAG2X1-3]
MIQDSKEGKYTTKEAAIIATDFSTVGGPTICPSS